jgi:serine/threonine-protein kinase
LLEGESLSERLKREGRLTPAHTARILTHVARALSRAHEAGVVHRDLKPDNVFIVRNEDDEIAKILDFGIAKSERHRLGEADSTRTGAVMGTPRYMSPEQISGAKGVDLRADLWAFGVIACECLTGRKPFDAQNYGALAVQICADPLPRPS